MGFVLALVGILGGFMWVLSMVLMLIAVCMFFGLMFWKKYQTRVIIRQTRADNFPLYKMDRGGLHKDKNGTKQFRLYFSKKNIEIPDDKYFYKGSILNPKVLYLKEENGRFTPMIDGYDNNGINLKPIDTNVERKRLSLERILKAKHDTMSNWEKNKGVIITAAACMIVVGILIVILTNKDKLKGVGGGLFGFAPVLFFFIKSKVRNVLDG